MLPELAMLKCWKQNNPSDCDAMAAACSEIKRFGGRRKLYCDAIRHSEQNCRDDHFGGDAASIKETAARRPRFGKASSDLQSESLPST